MDQNAVEDTITGGGGTGDTIAFSGGVTLAALDDFTNKVSGVELLSANGAQTGVISLTTHATFVSDTGISTIDLSGDTSSTGNNVIDISNQGTSTAMSLTGLLVRILLRWMAEVVDTVNVVATTGATTTSGATADVITAFDDAADFIDFGDMAAGTVANYAEASAAGGKVPRSVWRQD